MDRLGDPAAATMHNQFAYPYKGKSLPAFNGSISGTGRRDPFSFMHMPNLSIRAILNDY